MNGYQLCEMILELEGNIRVCFMSGLVVNIQALREVYPNVNLGVVVHIETKYYLSILKKILLLYPE
jgi:hypothetical protein